MIDEPVADKGTIARMLRRIPLTPKMILLTVMVGAFAWGLIDHIQTRKLKGIFLAELTKRLSQEALQGRLRFDQYIKAHNRSVKLMIAQKSFSDYIEEAEKKDWSSGDVSKIKSYKRPPSWFPEHSVLRQLVQPRYAFLLDARRRVREVYQGWSKPPPRSLLRPTDHLHRLTHNQSFMTDIDGSLYLVTMQSLLDSRKRLRAMLMLASPIDDKFLIASQGFSTGKLIDVLLSGGNPRILVSSRPDLLPPGIMLDTLEGRYLVTGKAYFDYGAADQFIGFASLISNEEVESLSKTVLSTERQQRAIGAFVLISSFSLVIFWITRYIRRLTQRIVDFSEQTLGVQPQEIQKGDQLYILEERFQHMTEEVISSHERLLHEKERLDVVTGHANCGLILLDKHVRITYANIVAEDWFGPLEQIKGKFCWEVCKLKDPEERCAALGVLRTGKTFNSEVFTGLVNEEEKFFYTIASPVKDSKGRIQQITEVVIDITERKRAEAEKHLLLTITQEINKSRDFQSAMETVLCNVCKTTGWNYGEAWMPRPDGTCLECSPVFYTSTKSLESFRSFSKNITFKPDTGLPGRVWSSKQPEWILDVSAQPDSFFLRTQMAKENGLKAAFGVPIIDNDHLLAVLVFFMFRSHEEDRHLIELVSAVATQLGSLFQRKKMEEEIEQNYDIQTVINSLLRLSMKDIALDDILKQAIDLILSSPWLLFEPRGSIFLVENDPNVLVMKTHKGLAEPIQKQCERIPFGKCLCGRAALTKEIQFTDCLNDNHEISFEGITPHGHYCVPIMSAGRILGVINIYVPEGHPRSQKDEDFLSAIANALAGIIERKRAEEKIERFAEKLKQSNRELQDFAYVASHDLQEPLRKVTAFGGRLKEKCGETLGEQGLDYLERMQNAAGRMHNLINGLLTFSRVTIKAQPFLPVDLTKVVKEVLSDLEVRIEQVKGRVEVSELPTIDADPLQIRQLLQNLIGNALKFHKKDESPVIKVIGRFINSNGKNSNNKIPNDDLYQLTVQDNGIGFDEKYLDRIFGVFQRLHSHSEYDGTGIGLSICRKIVERHGGSISAKSTLGQGAAFIVTLPVKQLKGKDAI